MPKTHPLFYNLLLALFLTTLIVPTAAWADMATIELKTGEVTEAEVLKLEFGKQLTVRLSDGSEKTIPWSEIENLEMAESTGESTPAGPYPAAGINETTPVAPSSTVTPSSTATPSSEAAASSHVTPPSRHNDFQRLQIVEKEIDDLKDDRPGVGGPITLMAIGYPVGLLFLASGIAISNNCYSMCGSASIPSFVISGISFVSAIAGTAWLAGNLKARGRTDEKIDALEEERDRLRFDLKANGNGAYGTATILF